MKNIGSFGIFMLVLVFTVVVSNIFTGIVVALGIIFLSMALYFEYPESQKYLGGVISNIGSNGNKIRFYLCVSLTFFSLVFSMNYGFGEPLFSSIFNDYKNNMTQETKNSWTQFYYGSKYNLADRNIDVKLLKIYLKEKYKQLHPAKTSKEFYAEKKCDRLNTSSSEMEEIKNELDEKNSNWMKFKIFCSDKLMSEYINNFEKDRVWKKEWEKNNAYKSKTWLPWELTILFLLLSIFYLLFVIVEHFLLIIDNLIKKIKKTISKNDLKNKNDNNSDGPSMPTMYFSSLASRISVKMLTNFKKLLMKH